MEPHTPSSDTHTPSSLSSITHTPSSNLFPNPKLTPFPTPTPISTPRPRLPTLAATASDPAALALLQRPTEVAEDIEGMRSSVNMMTNALGQSVSMTMDMEVIQDGRARIVMRMDTPDGEQELEMILASGYVH